MNYLPELRSALVQAADRVADSAEPVHPRAARPQPGRAGWHERAGAWRRTSRLRWVAVNLAIGLAGTAIGLGAAGVFHRGTTLGPEVPPSPSSDDGVATPRGVTLLPLRVADPGGGLPWGIRVVRTTRGLTCVGVGRVDFDTIGVLGQDGAFGDDGRFHPISQNMFEGLGCDTTDARGNGFVNVALQNIPASGLQGGQRSAGGCRVAEEQDASVLRRFRAQSYSLHARHPAMPTCPQADMREIYFGLLGPDARSITYREPGGGTRMIPTVGPQGAYLLVFPQATRGCLAPSPLHGGRPACPYGGRGQRGGPEVPSGVISTVVYRNGHTCHVATPGTFASMFGSCAPVGYVSPPRHRLTTAQLATPISVRELPARFYCASREAFAPCDGRVPPGFKRLTGGWPALLVQVGFTSRVPIPDSRSFYEIEMSYPHRRGCDTGGGNVPTDSDIRAGERVTQRMFVPYRCAGVVHGSLSYIPTEGAATSMPVTGLPGQGKPVLVGRFTFDVPAR